MTQDLLDDLLQAARGKLFGKYRGEVTGNQDPANVGRLKVKVPSVLGTVEPWAMPCVPYAGQGVGFYSLPAAGTGVWVEFEGGDVSFPIWTGCFWRPGDLPDPGGPDIKIWKTEKLTIRIDDSADELKIETTAQATITVTDSIEAKAGQGTLDIASDSISATVVAGSVKIDSSSVSVNGGALKVQ